MLNGDGNENGHEINKYNSQKFTRVAPFFFNLLAVDYYAVLHD